MRQFEIKYRDGMKERMPLNQIANAFNMTDEAIDQMADLQVGGTMVDQDGDTWTRIE